MMSAALSDIRLSLILTECFEDFVIPWYIHNTYIHSRTILNKSEFLFLKSRKGVCIDEEDWIEKYVEFDFFMLFRLQKHSFEKLLNEITINNPQLLKKYLGGYVPLNPQKALLMFLRYLATDETLLSISNRFGVVPSTLHKAISVTLDIFIKMKSEYIFWPTSNNELKNIAAHFKKYPNVVGVIDGCHIRLKVSQEDQDSYIDRYHQHSVNLMAICTNTKLFTHIFVGFPGSAHDSRVFKNSEFYINIERHGSKSYFQDTKYHIIGDSAFGCYLWLMTPFKNPRTEKERYHNYILSSDRVVIENVFALLKGRWRKLNFIDVYSIRKAIKIIVAACVLHNWCIIQKDIWTEVTTCEMCNINMEEGTNTREGMEKRNIIADLLFENR